MGFYITLTLTLNSTHTYDGGGALDMQWFFSKMTDLKTTAVTSLLSPHPCFLKNCDSGAVKAVVLTKIE